MDISQLIEMVKTPLTETDLNRVCDLTDNQLHQFAIQYHTPERDGMQRIADIIERDICNLYIATKGMHPLVYWDDAVFFEIYVYTEPEIKQMRIKDMIDQRYKSIERITNGDNAKLGALMYLCDSTSRYLVFKHIYNQIPDNKKYEFFKDLYVSSDYGFQMFTEEFIEDVMKHKEPIPLKKMALNFPSLENGEIIVYRGMGSKSTPADKAWSWTTNFNTAVFFATRFDLSGKIIQGKILLDDVIDYIDDRNESEVFVNPNDVKNIHEMKLLDLEAIQDELVENGVIDQYHDYGVYIDSDNYERPNGIHGILHTKRVLLLALIIAYYENMDYEDIELLAWAAIIHDIGRVDEVEDEEHGAVSFEKAYDLGIIPDFSDEDMNLLKYIVETHSMSDGNLMKDDKAKYGFNNELRALRLYKAFKDADGLDRVRLKDLNTKFLRTESANKMVLLAHQFLRGIK